MSGFVAWQRDERAYFGAADPAYEGLHRPWPEDMPFDLVETSYFGFSVPEAAIRGEIYHITRPYFGVTSGGLILYRGRTESPLDSLYSNYLNYMPTPENIADCTYHNGISVQRIGEDHFAIAYADAAAGVRLELEARGHMPPAFRPRGGHFTQGMENSGTLTVAGETHRIAGFSARDRSWGDPRPEARADVPQVGWHCASFGDDLAFHLIAFNSPDRDPALARAYPWLADGGHHIWGYVWKDGRLRGVRASSHWLGTTCDGVSPAEVVMEIEDETGERFALTGTIAASQPVQIWPNCTIYFCMTDWHFAGRRTVGETQTGVYQAFRQKALRGHPTPR